MFELMDCFWPLGYSLQSMMQDISSVTNLDFDAENMIFQSILPICTERASSLYCEIPP